MEVFRKLTALIFLLGVVLLFWGQAAQAEESQCAGCHTDASRLKQFTKAPEKVLVDPEVLEDENHGELTCEDCHKGDPEAEGFKAAHKGVIRDPSFPGPGVCMDCHDMDHYTKSLHYNNRGMRLPVDKRAGSASAVKARIDTAFKENCAGCHSSCGQCHVSRPAVVGGGLISGHRYVKTPENDQTCLACHNSRVGDEYTGRIEGAEPDVHFEEAEMNCQECHPGDQMHGADKQFDHRYQVENGPACLNCHEEIYEADAENKKTHGAHKDRVSCHVCHAQPYRNCFGCHVKKSKEGRAYFEVKARRSALKIGFNPSRNEKRPEKVVTLRHVPVLPDTFKAYKAGGLADFSRLPTWTPATPHNIRRKTPQNSDCNNCHGFKNKKLYLTLWDVEPGLRKANRKVIVPPRMIPAKIVEDSGPKK